MAKNVVAYAAIAIAAASIALAIAVSSNLVQLQERVSGLVPAVQESQTREFYLFSEVDENIVEEELGIPPDKFSLAEITVNRGDSVVIHFYNLEPEETQERHTFTIFETYQMNHDINAGEDVNIEFVADEAGIFQYACVYHMPTMTGNLVVLSP